MELFMDICLIETKSGVNIRPSSVHGMLWLQTHFEDMHWESLSTNQALIPHNQVQDLYVDAEGAGLLIKLIPVLSKSLEKF